MRMAVALVALASGAGLAAMGLGWRVAGGMRELPQTLPGWTAEAMQGFWIDLLRGVPERLSWSPVESGLLGVILFLLAVLTWVLARGPYAPEIREREAREAQMVQDLYRELMSVEERLELLESLVLQRAGRLSFGRKTN